MPEPLSSIVELRDLVKAMAAAEGWEASERAVLGTVSEQLITHVFTEQRKYAREVGECLRVMLDSGKPLALSLREVGEIFGAELDPPAPVQDEVPTDG